ncbi:hypothetical protein BH11PSE11_BH11PSE11_37970 [soil metagenome]
MSYQIRTLLASATILLSLIVDAAHAGVPQINAGVGVAAALKSDGTVLACGSNSAGQLGIGTVDFRPHPTPVNVGGLNGIVSLATGDIHTLALRFDGTVWAAGAVGFNNFGQLGNGNNDGSASPVQVPGLTSVAAIAAGELHSVALKSDGTVWTWGWNNFGQLGNGTTTDAYTPIQVPGMDGVTAISAGFGTTAALKSNGTVWVWGANSSGQLGNGTNQSFSSVPVQVLGLTGVTYISQEQAGNDGHTLALKADGTVWAWGGNSYGQLGNGSFTDSYVPVKVASLSGITAVSSGAYFSVALKNDGTVLTWGLNSNGRLGNGIDDNNVYPIPTQIQGLNSVASINAGAAFGMALKGNGEVWSWGDNFDGQICNNSTARAAVVPVLTLLNLGTNVSAQGNQVVEFYHAGLDHFFIAANAAEASGIDQGAAGAGWVRTGNAFKIGGNAIACRFYGSLNPGPNSHFFTVSDAECKGLIAQQASTPATQKRWNFESYSFSSTLPADRFCPSGTIPVYRAYNNGFARGIDSNHRITSNLASIHEVIARGWVNEGVVMCAPQ